MNSYRRNTVVRQDGYISAEREFAAAAHRAGQGLRSQKAAVLSVHILGSDRAQDHVSTFPVRISGRKVIGNIYRALVPVHTDRDTQCNGIAVLLQTHGSTGSPGEEVAVIDRFDLDGGCGKCSLHRDIGDVFCNIQADSSRNLELLLAGFLCPCQVFSGSSVCFVHALVCRVFGILA